MTARKRVLVAGGTNFDIIVQSERLPEEHEKLRGGEYAALPGGSAANTALGLARQGCEVRLVSAVGDDALGRLCLDDLRAGGVDTSLARVDASARTSMAIVLSSGDCKRMMTFAGADREQAVGAVAERDVRDVDHVHVVGEPTPALTRLVDLAHRAGRSVSVEWNGRDMSRLARGASLSFMNADEAARLPDAVLEDPAASARRRAELISGDVILTMGSRGAVWASPHGELFQEPTVRVEPVDRTGGGDAFNAGVIAGWLSGDPPGTCLRRGLDAALHVITKIGAHP
ncbi:carbohydrate kinase family protein [Streptomyces sp. H27-D2]|uniref:carbohydrate kinase family protein n=1 Tax=Streptomyces sp. H27-D2 TaxID=3046304 RepID=UPI002DB5E07C|nr:carbohydrate kinase family protein [Streptomyces sp. H27-D2]MEC4019494.1 carbohydrate kinase family protein [Streptomyces sp. H27-D2]